MTSNKKKNLIFTASYLPCNDTMSSVSCHVNFQNYTPAKILIDACVRVCVCVCVCVYVCTHAHTCKGTSKGKGKLQFILEEGTKAHTGRRGIDLPFLNLSTRWRFPPPPSTEICPW